MTTESIKSLQVFLLLLNAPSPQILLTALLQCWYKKKRNLFSEDEMDTEKQRLRPSPLLLQIQKRKKKEKKTPPPESFGCKKRSGEFHSLQYAGEKRLTRCSAGDMDTTKKCASKFALIQRTKTTIKCSHADRTVFCLLLHRKTCVGFRAGESQMRFRLGQKPSVYSSTTIVRYEWREPNKKTGGTIQVSRDFYWTAVPDLAELRKCL